MSTSFSFFYLSAVSFFAGGELLFFESVDSRLQSGIMDFLSIFLSFSFLSMSEVESGAHQPYLSGLESAEWRFTGWPGFESQESFLQRRKELWRLTPCLKKSNTLLRLCRTWSSVKPKCNVLQSTFSCSFKPVFFFFDVHTGLSGQNWFTFGWIAPDKRKHLFDSLKKTTHSKRIKGELLVGALVIWPPRITPTAQQAFSHS